MALARATVGGKVTAAITNGIIDFVESPFDHIEFTATSASVATATTASVGTLTYDAAKSNVASIGTISTNTITLAEAGLYSIDLVGSIPASPTGNYFAQFTTDGVSFFKINGTTSSGAIGGALASNFYAATAGVVLTFTFFHTSAANRVLTSRIAITKVGS